MRGHILFLVVCFPSFCFSQILDITPSFPTQQDQVTIVYDATQGNGALTGQAEIYCHTGLITQASSGPGSWQHVQGNWGAADPNVLMTSLGNNLFEIIIDIPSFYGFPGGTEVYQLAFVFRNADGSIVGRDTDGSDIFYDVYPVNGPLVCELFNPVGDIVLLDVGDNINILGESNLIASLSVFWDNVLIDSQVNSTTISVPYTVSTDGTHNLVLIADNGINSPSDSISIMVNPSVNVADPPGGTVLGANYIDDSTVILELYAPDKNHVYVIGDFNNWMPSVAFHMNRGTDGATWWLKISGLTPGNAYGYQYYIDGEMKVADPLSQVILDPDNDWFISADSYPNPHPYPTNQTSGFVSMLYPGSIDYEWTISNFSGAENKDLIIYELLVRDFTHDRNYQTLIDTLDYLETLGINAIELMPPGEFENNESWGYNPSFHMALDKYYGTPDKFKEFVDSCHSRGISVIVDMVLNHAFGQSPMVNMYWDAVNNKPAANNPWFNVDCPHEPFCWGYDIDHTSQATKDYMDRVNLFWISEYKVDGFRFDFTKGFVNSSANYSTERINILKRMADTIWSVYPETYVILEHWSDNNEEKILAEYGMMLWGNITHAYQDAAMGYTNSSNLSNGVYLNRSWDVPHLVSYMESHDEERMMFKNITFGNTSNSSHNTQNSYVALTRMQAAATIFLLQPGPKLIWQFGELGYDISIEDPCRTCVKPVLWNYFEEPRRRQLYDVYAALIHLRNTYPTFQTLDVDYALGGAFKRLRHNHTDMNAITLTNFNVQEQSGIPAFHHTGWWYEYFSGDSIYVSDVNASLILPAGGYVVYTDVRLETPLILETDLGFTSNELGVTKFYAFPNPVTDELYMEINAINHGPAHLSILDPNGRIAIEKELLLKQGTNDFSIPVDRFEAGLYFIELNYSGKREVRKISIQ